MEIHLGKYNVEKSVFNPCFGVHKTDIEFDKNHNVLFNLFSQLLIQAWFHHENVMHFFLSPSFGLHKMNLYLC